MFISFFSTNVVPFYIREKKNLEYVRFLFCKQQVYAYKFNAHVLYSICLFCVYVISLYYFNKNRT